MPQFIAVGRVVDELARRGGALGEKVDAPLVELVKELVQPLPGVGGAPSLDSVEYSCPNEAFLRPTSATSPSRMSENQRI